MHAKSIDMACLIARLPKTLTLDAGSAGPRPMQFSLIALSVWGI